jgi:hypothetical protein
VAVVHVLDNELKMSTVAVKVLLLEPPPKRARPPTDVAASKERPTESLAVLQVREVAL